MRSPSVAGACCRSQVWFSLLFLLLFLLLLVLLSLLPLVLWFSVSLC
ncbi:MAG: hypothetical protein PVF43_09420 [Candidatus Eiseniibacteriota bacterium]